MAEVLSHMPCLEVDISNSSYLSGSRTVSRCCGTPKGDHLLGRLCVSTIIQRSCCLTVTRSWKFHTIVRWRALAWRRCRTAARPSRPCT